MPRSTKEIAAAALFFVATLLVALGLFAGPSYSDTQRQTIITGTPHSFLPYVVNQPTPTPTATATSAPEVIKIINVFRRSPLPKNYEYVEIANQGSSAVDMSYWKLKNISSGELYNFPVFTLLPGRTVKVYSRNGTNDDDELFWNHREHSQPIWDPGETACLYKADMTQVDCYGPIQ